MLAIGGTSKGWPRDDFLNATECTKEMQRDWTAIESFTGQMDLTLDLSKTLVWSTNAGARQLFRSGPITVTLAAGNLGAHHNFSRHCHNAELQKRLAKLPQVRSTITFAFRGYESLASRPQGCKPHASPCYIVGDVWSWGLVCPSGYQRCQGPW